MWNVGSADHNAVSTSVFWLLSPRLRDDNMNRLTLQSNRCTGHGGDGASGGDLGVPTLSPTWPFSLDLWPARFLSESLSLLVPFIKGSSQAFCIKLIFKKLSILNHFTKTPCGFLAFRWEFPSRTSLSALLSKTPSASHPAHAHYDLRSFFARYFHQKKYSSFIGQVI